MEEEKQWVLKSKPWHQASKIKWVVYLKMTLQAKNEVLKFDMFFLKTGYADSVLRKFMSSIDLAIIILSVAAMQHNFHSLFTGHFYFLLLCLFSSWRWGSFLVSSRNSN